jgi:PAS domain S-box-containing protein
MLILMAGGFSIYRWMLKRQIAWELETQRTGEQVRDALAEINTILKAVPVGIALLRDRRYVWVNQGMSEISGFPETELIGQETRIMYASPGDFERVGNKAYALLARGERFETEFPVKRKNGDQRWVAVTGQVIDVSNPAKGSIWVMEDISARKQAETMLRDRERQLGLILDFVPAQVAYFDAEQRYRFVNRSFEKWNGVSRAEILGKTLRDVRGEEAYRQRQPYVEATLSGRAQTVEDYFDFPGVGRRYVLAIGIPDFAPDGAVKGYYTIITDLTERKEAHERERETEKALRNTLVREVHHRVKNTLQGAILLLDASRRAHPELSVAMEPAVTRLNAMAAVFGLQAAEGEQTVVLCKLVPEICGVLAKAMKCSIEPLIQSDIVRPVQIAESERVPVALIVNELVFNAIKHGRPGEPVRVFLDSDGASVSVRVVSAGAVLPPGFDFESGVGVGTGLQLVKSMLTKEGTRVEITSGPEGVSAKLVLRPPVIRPVHGAAL